MKKLTSLLLSLLMCISLLPGQAHAADVPEDAEPPAVVEAVEPESSSAAVYVLSEGNQFCICRARLHFLKIDLPGSPLLVDVERHPVLNERGRPMQPMSRRTRNRLPLWRLWNLRDR